MSEIPRLAGHRFVGDRRTMTVYDCDDAEQSKIVSEAIEEEDLVSRLQIQTFGPDTLTEARNRGFRPLPPAVSTSG